MSRPAPNPGSGGIAADCAGSRAAEGREFIYTERDFEQIKAMIYRMAGVVLGPARQDMVYSRLARRLRARGLKCFSEYIAAVDREPPERDAFVGALTTHLTHFFREAHHFEELAHHAARQRATPPYRVWCAGVSTGEEAWSVAIALAERHATFSPPVSVVGTDVDVGALARAERAVYPNAEVGRLSPERQRRFFVGADGGVQVRGEIRRLASFRRLNLLEPLWPVQGPFDAILCRNVMIYFDQDAQRRILERFVRYLKPDGLLMLGHSENLNRCSDLYEGCGRTVYRLKAPAPPQKGV